MLEGNMIPREEVEKFFAPISPAASTGSNNSLLEFLQRGKFPAAPKQGDAAAAPSAEARLTNRSPIQGTNSQQAAGKVHSVEELEAHMRNAIDLNNATAGRIPPDMQAFKKLLEQLSGDGMVLQVTQQQQQQATELMQLFNKSQLAAQQRQQQLQREPFAMIDGQPKCMANAQQVRNEILKRPEAQALIVGISKGEITQTSLLHQLSNPNIHIRQREVVMAVMNFCNSSSRVPSPNVLAMAPPQQQQQQQHPQASQAIQPNVMAGECMNSQMLFQHHSAAAANAAANAQKQLRVSPLPNGIIKINTQNIELFVYIFFCRSSTENTVSTRTTVPHPVDYAECTY